MKLIWTAFAAEQLESIYHFLKNKSERAAVAVYNDILDETGRFVTFSGNGASRAFIIGVYRNLSVLIST